ncbi:MAG TPA: preprotein translocase subunit SecG, partial [Xanthomonadales bacterium]|nr:preprotein translocase subunit SecG [Xanthomonadales bacterium]
MTTLTILNVFYVFIAIAMIGFILVQRGAGAQAGSGFGAGASATVFGARGAGNFLSKTTKYLAIVFFAFSLGMGIFVTRGGMAPVAGEDLGIM